LAEWEAKKSKLDALDATIYTVSTDSLEHAREVVGKGLSFNVAYDATREDGSLVGAWWGEEHDGFIQPAEFLLGRGGVVLGAMYASGPVGRMGADEAVRLITNRERRRLEREQAGGA
jgi:peroxiredoxin